MILKLLPIVVFLYLTAGACAQLTEQSRRESVKSFDGIELPEAANWIGESKSVAYEPPPGDSWRAIEHAAATMKTLATPLLDGDDLGVVVTDDDWRTPPIGLVSFNQRIVSDAQASVSVSQGARTARKSQFGASNEFPMFANIVNESGTLLANSQAYSQQEGTANDTTVRAQGRVGAYADIRSSLSSADSHAKSNSSSYLTAKYNLTREYDFILDTTLAADLVEDGFSFRLRHVASNEDLIDFQPDDGQAHRLEMCGTLSRGIYELIVETAASASTHTSGTPDLGGVGKFDFYFRIFDENLFFGSEDERDSPYFAIPTADKDVPVRTSEGNTEWIKIDFWMAEGSAEEARLVYLGDELTANSVPEPSARVLVFSSLLLFLLRKRRV